MSCQDCCSVNFSLWGTRWRIFQRVIVICVSRSTDIFPASRGARRSAPDCRYDRVCMTRRWRKMDSSNRSPMSRPATRTTFRSSLWSQTGTPCPHCTGVRQTRRPAPFGVGRLFLSRLRPRRVAPSRSAVWHRASHRALRRGRPACVGQSRRRHGSGERLCMQR
jgi:hypothetical protein